MTDTSGAPVGQHLLIDFFRAIRLGDLYFVEQACLDAARATGATVLDSNFHHFGEGCGLSGVVLLAESHLSIHTWPEHGTATLDVFVCGQCDASLALPILVDRLQPAHVHTRLIGRGAQERPNRC